MVMWKYKMNKPFLPQLVLAQGVSLQQQKARDRIFVSRYVRLTCRTCGGQKVALDPQRLGLQVFVRCLKVLGIELGPLEEQPVL